MKVRKKVGRKEWKTGRKENRKGKKGGNESGGK